MTLYDWVYRKGGPVKVAPLLGVTPHAIRRWFNRQNSPNPKTMLKIVKLSKGRVKLEQIMHETVRVEDTDQYVEKTKQVEITVIE
jgi:hypothetical protein